MNTALLVTVAIASILLNFALLWARRTDAPLWRSLLKVAGLFAATVVVLVGVLWLCDLVGLGGGGPSSMGDSHLE